MTIDPREINPVHFQKLLQGTVAPRPIALVSTSDKEGKINLSPFSFFNCFSINPPILVFSPSRRVRDNTTKHTLENILEVPEAVINMVSFEMVEQTSLSSTEYDKEVNEFEKAGFTEIPSLRVMPPRVKESPASYECRVKSVIPLGESGGAGNLVICEVLLLHFNENLLDNNENIDPQKIDLIARMGNDFYCRASGDALFEVPKPVKNKGIGIDRIPEVIRNSKILTGNNLGRLGNVERIPAGPEISTISSDPEVEALNKETLSEVLKKNKKEELAKKWIEAGRVEDAWKLLLLKSK